jgi:hypothetical protein
LPYKGRRSARGVVCVRGSIFLATLSQELQLSLSEASATKMPNTKKADSKEGDGFSLALQCSLQRRVSSCLLTHCKRVRQPRPERATAAIVTTCPIVTFGTDKLTVSFIASL